MFFLKGGGGGGQFQGKPPPTTTTPPVSTLIIINAERAGSGKQRVTVAPHRCGEKDEPEPEQSSCGGFLALMLLQEIKSGLIKRE